MIAILTSYFLAQSLQSIDRDQILTLPAFPNGSVSLRLHEMSVISPTVVVAHVVDGRESTEQIDSSLVKLWKATSTDGRWNGFFAFGSTGGIGWIESNGERLVLVGDDSADAHRLRTGLRPGPWHLEPEGRPSAPPIENICGVTSSDDEGSLAGGSIPGANLATLPRIVELAVDADYEFVSVFASPMAAIEYIFALYGANSYILERDCNTRLKLVFVRTFDTPNDLYNEPDPLGPFRNEWVANQEAISRDLAQLLTGRRNLPYGGVAWLNAACTSHGYSVSGYMIGSFADATATNPGNWDIIVSSHEIGHNIGTRHTHDYGIDTCANGGVQRGTIMSYCHIVSGATSNIDLRFHRGTGEAVVGWAIANAPCLASDCNGNGIDDALDIASGDFADSNLDTIPDHCQDCDGDGLLDPFEIGLGEPDADLNGRPDGCDIDCDANGIPDLADIATDPSTDADGNFIRDSCQSDCNGDGIADGVNLILTVALDLDRDGRIDSCEDCDANGVADPADLDGALGVWSVQFSPPLLIELDGRSGVRRRVVDPVVARVQSISAVETAPDGSILVAATIAGQPALLKFNRATAQFSVITAGDGGFPIALRIRMVPGTSGALAACDALDGVGRRITRWRLSDGAPLGTVVQLPSGSSPRSFARQGPAFLVVNSDGSIVRSASEGATPLPFASLDAGSDASDVLVATDGRVLVSDRATDSIRAFSTVGASLGRFDFGPNPTSSVALNDPQSLLTARQNPGVVFALASGASAALHGFRLDDGYYLRTYRIYRNDTIGADAFAQIGTSPLDSNANFELDSCEGVLRADVNGDGRVDGIDLTTILSAWGSSNALADLDHDGTVSGPDLTALLSAWTG